jgi:1,2-diacylglycerol 3-alpha-glucosyltransferase
MLAKCVVILRNLGSYHVARIAAAQSTPSLEVTAIELTRDAGFAEFNANIANVADSVVQLKLREPLNFEEVQGSIVAALNAQQPDVVFVPGWSAVEALVALKWCTEKNVPAVIMSESTKHDHERHAYKELLKRRILSLASAVFVGGQAHAEYMLQLGASHSSTFFGYDAVNNKSFQEGARRARADAASHRARLGLPQHFFLCAARLIEKKNLYRLLEAFAKYVAQSKDAPWSLVIAGPGPLKDALEVEIERLNLKGRALLLGAVNHQDMVVCYGLAEALVHPSTTEQWGLVVNEAMAAGLPVLVSDRCGCVSDLVEDGRNGFVFDPYDVNAICAALVRVSNDTAARLSMSEESQRIIANWGLERFADGFLAATRTAMQAKKLRASLFDKALLTAVAFASARKNSDGRVP